MIKYLIYSLVSSIVGLTTLFLTNKILYAVIVFIIFIIFFILLDQLFIKKIDKRIKANKDLYYFIHDFIIGYYRNHSLNEAISFSTLHTSYGLVEQIKLLDEYKDIEKLERLCTYFNHPLYFMFYRTLFDGKGKNLIDSLNRIMKTNNENIIKRENNEKNLKKSLIKYSLLWAISFIIVILLRILVTNQYAKINNSPIYVVGVIAFILLFLLSNYIFVVNYFKGQL